MHHLQDPD